MTLIKIAAFVPEISEEVVGDLIRATTARGNACVYAPVNGSPHYARVTDGAGAHVVVDQDVAASVVDPATQMRHWYECGVPSLTILAPSVSAIEEAHGSALLVLDGIQGARPYNQSSHGDETVAFGDFVTLDRHGLDKWRAADVLAYAQARPQAPTVAVWHTSLLDENQGGFAALVDVAHVVVDRCELVDGPRMLFSARSCLDEPLPFQAPVW